MNCVEVTEALSKLKPLENFNFGRLSQDLSMSPANFVLRYWKGKLDFIDRRIRPMNAGVETIADLFTSYTCEDVSLTYDPNYGFIIRFFFTEPILWFEIRQESGMCFGEHSVTRFTSKTLKVINPEYLGKIAFEFETAVVEKNIGDFPVKVEE